MVHGFLLDRSVLIDGQSSLADLRKRKVNPLRVAELIGERKDSGCGVTSTRLHGLETQTRDGKIGPDRWRTCADDFNRPIRIKPMSNHTFVTIIYELFTVP